MGLQHGRLIRRHDQAEDILFSSELSLSGGEPAALELHALDLRLQEDELVVVEGPDGVVYSCRMVGRTSVCEILDSRSVDASAA